MKAKNSTGTIAEKSSSDRSKKSAFTIRLENDILKDIEKVAQNLQLPASSVARSYIQFSKYFIVQSNLAIKAFNDDELMVFPWAIFIQCMRSLPEERQVEIGDSLGIHVNDNAEARQFAGLEEKLHFIRALNWLEMRIIEEEEKEAKPEKEMKKVKRNWWVSAKNVPLLFVHGLLYRVINNRKYPNYLTLNLIRDYGAKSPEELTKIKDDKDNKKKNLFQDLPNQMRVYREELGGKPENFQEDVAFYKFDKLHFETVIPSTTPVASPPAGA